MSEKIQNSVQVNVFWDQNFGVPTPINQFNVLQGPSQGDVPSPLYELHFGHVSPPLVDFNAEAVLPESLNIPIHRIGHFQASIDFLRQANSILSEVIKAHDEQAKHFQG